MSGAQGRGVKVTVAVALAAVQAVNERLVSLRQRAAADARHAPELARLLDARRALDAAINEALGPTVPLPRCEECGLQLAHQGAHRVCLTPWCERGGSR